MTKIEWTDESWNPIVGCSVATPGCTNCYAMRFAGQRLDGNPNTPHYAGLTQESKAGPVWTGRLARASERTLTQPLRWARPRRVFVNSMGDLFHEETPDEWIDQVFAVMALAPQHTFQILTKRAGRMRDYLTRPRWRPVLDYGRDERPSYYIAEAIGERADRRKPGDWPVPDFIKTWGQLADFTAAIRRGEPWPLPNVWLGVSAEDQKRADERVLLLLDTPATVRFVSAEPMLGAIDLTGIMDGPAPTKVDALSGHAYNASGEKFPRRPWPSLDWVIVGGESGPGARPMHPDWARSLRDQCDAAGVPFFFKQWGEWVTGLLDGDDFIVDEDAHGSAVAWRGTARCVPMSDGGHFGRVGKKAAGRKLDGAEYSQFPKVAPV